ncbi:hypothetical protein [Wenzhouxiangella sp. XN24]|uniref:hypothetical protein n=1 Tax=Wenzhouxiangella sp. XN24 TaxID=2713569 RepID=UPI0013EB6141|nr:hypothetical protein [Wenzhouxiangella sp. XN24]NGX16379.1 hypothetical protein [Wenzhouxiangella sp. XN24]
MLRSQSVLSALATVTMLAASVPTSASQPNVESDGPYQVMTQSLPDGQLVIAVMLRGVASTDLAHYQGPCGEQIEADLSINDRADVTRFEKSGKFADLNADGLAGRLVEQLQSACPELERVDTVLANRPDRPRVASFARSAGWANTAAALSVAAAANPVDAQIAALPSGPRVMLAVQDLLTGIALRGYAICQDRMTLPLGSMNSSGARKPSLGTFRRFAEMAAPQVQAQCPDVMQIRFIPGPMADTFICTSQDCSVDATLANGMWSAVATGYGASRDLDTIKTFDDVLGAMVAGDLSEIRNRYTGYFRQFHNEFLIVYSKTCPTHIADPVSFQIVLIERTIDQDGFTIGSRQASEPYTLTIDRKFEPRYFAYDQANQAYYASSILSREVDARSAGSTTSGAESVIGEIIDGRHRIQSFVNKGCAHNDVQSVYARLDQVLGN